MKPDGRFFLRLCLSLVVLSLAWCAGTTPKTSGRNEAANNRRASRLNPPQTTSPLLTAAQKGNAAAVKRLLKSGADVNVRDTINNYSSTPLMYAAFGGHKEIVEILIAAGADVNLEDRTGKTALMDAGNKIEIIELLLAAGAEINTVSDYGTALRQAAFKNDIEMVKYFLAKGADMEAANEKATTALHGASFNGHVEVMKVLLAAGANVNTQSKRDGYTATMVAAARGHVEAVKILVAAGADLDRRNHRFQTASDVTSNENYYEIIRILKPGDAASSTPADQKIYSENTVTITMVKKEQSPAKYWGFDVTVVNADKNQGRILSGTVLLQNGSVRDDSCRIHYLQVAAGATVNKRVQCKFTEPALETWDLKIDRVNKQPKGK